MDIWQCWREADKSYIDPESGRIPKIQALECIIAQVFNIAVTLAGTVLFLMFIVGGFKYLTAGGDQKAIESARNTLTYAILGLVLIIAGWFILLFIKEFTGINVTQFTFPQAP